MKRKAVVKTLPASKGSSVSELAKEWHIHQCAAEGCNYSYRDYDCPDVNENRLCTACRGMERPFWERSTDARDCCYGNTGKPLTRDHRVRQKLAGPGPWFQCQTCQRYLGWPAAESDRPIPRENR